MSAALSFEPPDDWLDPVVVERFLAEREPGRPLTTAERDAVVGHLVDHGSGPTHIAKRLNISHSTANYLIANHRRNRG